MVMTTRQRNVNRLGLVLTWLAGIAGVVISAPVVLLAGWSVSLIGGGISDTFLACHDQASMDENGELALLSLTFLAAVIVLIVLAIWSSTRALIVVRWEPRELLLLVAAIAATLALGTALRLWSRVGRPEPDD